MNMIHPLLITLALLAYARAWFLRREGRPADASNLAHLALGIAASGFLVAVFQLLS